MGQGPLGEEEVLPGAQDGVAPPCWLGVHHLPPLDFQLQAGGSLLCALLCPQCLGPYLARARHSVANSMQPEVGRRGWCLGPSRRGCRCQVRALQAPRSSRQRRGGPWPQRQGGGAWLQPGNATGGQRDGSFRRELSPAGTLVLDFRSPAWEGVNVCYPQPPCLRMFVTAAVGDASGSCTWRGPGRDSTDTNWWGPMSVGPRASRASVCALSTPPLPLAPATPLGKGVASPRSSELPHRPPVV